MDPWSIEVDNLNRQIFLMFVLLSKPLEDKIEITKKQLKYLDSTNKIQMEVDSAIKKRNLKKLEELVIKLKSLNNSMYQE